MFYCCFQWNRRWQSNNCIRCFVYRSFWRATVYNTYCTISADNELQLQTRIPNVLYYCTLKTIIIIIILSRRQSAAAVVRQRNNNCAGNNVQRAIHYYVGQYVWYIYVPTHPVSCYLPIQYCLERNFSVTVSNLDLCAIGEGEFGAEISEQSLSNSSTAANVINYETRVCLTRANVSRETSPKRSPTFRVHSIRLWIITFVVCIKTFDYV